MKNIFQVLLVILLGLSLFACSSSDSTPTTNGGGGNNGGGGGGGNNGGGGGNQTPITLSSIQKGKVYYENNCGMCHRVKNNDITAAFGASDLNKASIAKLAADMHLIGTSSTPNHNLMGRFTAENATRIAQLKEFITAAQVGAVN